jgi:hypothetical protein
MAASGRAMVTEHDWLWDRPPNIYNVVLSTMNGMDGGVLLLIYECCSVNIILRVCKAVAIVASAKVRRISMPTLVPRLAE